MGGGGGYLRISSRHSPVSEDDEICHGNPEVGGGVLKN